MLFANPLFRLTRNNEDQFFARGMIVKGMRPKWIHVGSHQEQLLVLNYVRAAHPFLQCPRRLKTHRVCGGDEAAENRFVSFVLNRLHLSVHVKRLIVLSCSTFHTQRSSISA